MALYFFRFSRVFFLLFSDPYQRTNRRAHDHGANQSHGLAVPVPDTAADACTDRDANQYSDFCDHCQPDHCHTFFGSNSVANTRAF